MKFGFSPASVEWEALGQSADGAVVALQLPDDADFDELADNLAALGYTEPKDDDGVWEGGIDRGAVVGRDLSERGDPHPRGVAHVVHQLAQAGQPRRPADDLGVEGEVRHPARLGDALELGQPALQHRSRRLHRPLPGEHEVGRVVEHPRHRDLHDPTAVHRLVQVRGEPIHHVRRVGEAVLDQQGNGGGGQLPGGRAVADGPRLAEPREHLDAAGEDGLSASPAMGRRLLDGASSRKAGL